MKSLLLLAILAPLLMLTAAQQGKTEEHQEDAAGSLKDNTTQTTGTHLGENVHEQNDTASGKNGVSNTTGANTTQATPTNTTASTATLATSSRMINVPTATLATSSRMINAPNTTLLNSTSIPSTTLSTQSNSPTTPKEMLITPQHTSAPHTTLSTSTATPAATVASTSSSTATPAPTVASTSSSTTTNTTLNLTQTTGSEPPPPMQYNDACTKDSDCAFLTKEGRCEKNKCRCSATTAPNFNDTKCVKKIDKLGAHCTIATEVCYLDRDGDEQKVECKNNTCICKHGMKPSKDNLYCGGAGALQTTSLAASAVALLLASALA